MHHPWAAFAALIDWKLVFAFLPEGFLGFTDYKTQTVTLDPRLTQAERRCTIAHETEHIYRGPARATERGREEAAVDRAAARKLIDIRDLGEALAWSIDLHQAADELWVDVDTLTTRLKHLHPAERAYLKRRLEHEGEHH